MSQVLGGLLSSTRTAPEQSASAPHTTAARWAATATARRLLGDDGATGVFSADDASAAGGESEPLARRVATTSATRLVQCPLLNVSVCNGTDRPPPEDKGTALVVLAYNPLAWQRRDVVRVPVRSAFQV